MTAARAHPFHCSRCREDHAGRDGATGAGGDVVDLLAQTLAGMQATVRLAHVPSARQRMLIHTTRAGSSYRLRQQAVSPIDTVKGDMRYVRSLRVKYTETQGKTPKRTPNNPDQETHRQGILGRSVSRLPRFRKFQKCGYRRVEQDARVPPRQSQRS